jgi:hypothetical protein
LYTWGESCPSQTEKLGLECIPMLWGADQDHIDKFKAAVPSGYKGKILSFNE